MQRAKKIITILTIFILKEGILVKMQEIIIKQENDLKKIVAVVENGKLVEKYEENEEKERLEGNIYLGKVENVLVRYASSIYRYRNRKKYIHSCKRHYT